MLPVQRSTFRHNHLIETPLLPPKMRLVWLRASKEIKIIEALLYSVFQAHCIQQQAYTEIAILGIIAAIV